MKRNHKTRRVLRKRKSRCTRRRGGDKIGHGEFGSVYRPPMKCADGSGKKYEGPEYISKVTEGITAYKELEISDIIRAEIPDYREYYCLVEHVCPFDPDSYPETVNIEVPQTEDRSYVAISQYGGISLTLLLRDIGNSYENNAHVIEYNMKNVPKITSSVAVGILRSLVKFIRGVKLLHSKRIFHLDIHPGNILYDIRVKKTYLIDFQAYEIADTKNAFIRLQRIDMEQLYVALFKIITKIVSSDILRLSNTIGDEELNYQLDTWLTSQGEYNNAKINTNSDVIKFISENIDALIGIILSAD